MQLRRVPVVFRVVAAQFLTSMVVSAGAWIIGGHRAAVSSLLGGLACTLPNGLFALHLAWLGRVPRSRAVDGGSGRATAYLLALLAGEFLKVVLTIGLLVLIARTVRDVVWLALIVGVSAVLLMQAAALIRPEPL
ncbi:MAG TPA: ATP synthase subunit I [Burkholderiaceae bacterium]|jgi:F0F1-type ATP synthase assembly protein I|nr:ATP synthase subunit I [Burkholderiaceae bacterium]